MKAWIGAILLSLCLLTSPQSFSRQVPILSGPATNLTSLQKDDLIRVAIWNIYKGQRENFKAEFTHLTQFSDLMLLQEVLMTKEQQAILEPSKDRTWVMAEAWKKSGVPTGTAIVSALNFEAAVGLISQDGQPITNTPKSSLALKIPIANHLPLLVINTHAINFTLNGPFERQMKEIQELISQHKGPVLWAGDFNTWRASRKTILDQTAAELGLREVELEDDPRYLVLDHAYVRGLSAQGAIVLDDYQSSDHWPLYLLLKVD